MITNSEDDRKFIKKVYDYFNKNIYNIQELSINNIYTCNDIKNDIYKFTNSTRKYENCNGYTIYENAKRTEDIIVLIQLDDSEFENTLTLFHELIHVYDFKLFFAKYKTLNHDCFYTYTIWSEFHAYYLSEKELIEFYKDFNQPNIISNFLNTKEEQISQIFDSIRKKYNGAISQNNKMMIFAKLYLFGYYDGADDYYVCEFIDFINNKDEYRVFEDLFLLQYLLEYLENGFCFDDIYDFNLIFH